MDLKRYLICGLIVSATTAAYAQGTPAITLHSENYDVYGDGAVITLALGSTQSGKVGVDCGTGIVEYDIQPWGAASSDTGVTATYISCTLSPQGNVKVYCYDDIAIDYFNGDGCGITDITFSAPEAIEVLSLRHNSLHALDLSEMCNVVSIDVGDNPFDVTPLIVGPDKPRLMILNLDIIENMDQSLSLTDYPALVTFDAYDNKSLYTCDPSQCPGLMKLSIDDTPVSSLDVSHNPELIILNIGGSDVRTIDVTNNTKLQQLYCSAMGHIDQSERISQIDVSNCPDLVYLFCAYNALTSIDLSNNPLLQDISLTDNQLTGIDLSNNNDLLNVAVDKNYMSFATLPSDPGYLSYQYRQHPIELPESYLVGTPIDLADRVLRPGTETTAVVYVSTPDGPMMYTEVDESMYSFVDGVLSINAKIDGEVFVEFYNSELYEYPMTTTWFKVKTEDEYGKNDLALTLTYPDAVSTALQMSIGMAGATPASPRHYYVELANGEMVEGLTMTDQMPTEPNFVLDYGAEGNVRVYVEEDGAVTAFGYAQTTLDGIDLSLSESLRDLSLVGTGLNDLYLGKNNQLRSLTLHGNDLADRFTLQGETGAYNKNYLEHIDVSDNSLTRFEVVVPEVLKYLNISHNHIDNLNLTDAEILETLDVSHNDLDYLRLSYQSSLKTFDGSYNKLSDIVLPETNVLQYFDISNNSLTFATLPLPSALPTDADYRYSDQAVISIPAQGMSCNLSAQYKASNNVLTAFAWVDSEGQTMTEGADYTISGGVTQFLPAAEGKSVHAEMTNPTYPGFVLCTSEMTLAGKPQYVVGEFTTPYGGRTANLSLGGMYEGSTVFIDWKGDGTLTEYLLKPTYTLYTATTTAGARVKVYSYEPQSEVTIFSVSGITMSDVDLSGMTNLYCLSLSGAGISEIKMPDASGLGELFLVGNKFTEFDLSKYPNINSLSFENNQFTDVDLSMLPNLQMVNYAGNKLKSINLGNNPNLWAIHLSNNQLDEIDLSTVPAAYQVTLDGNNLTHIDTDMLTDLRVLYIDRNRFTFETLPLPHEQWTVYHYGNQARIDAVAVDGVVDLSSQFMVNDTPTDYYWMHGQPWIDQETGELMGDMLTEGEDYVISGGVTTFLADVPDAVCMMYNELFPRAYLTTDAMSVTAGGIVDLTLVSKPIVKMQGGVITVDASPGTEVAVYTIDGSLMLRSRCDMSGHLTLPRMQLRHFIVTVSDTTFKY